MKSFLNLCYQTLLFAGWFLWLLVGGKPKDEGWQ